MENDEDSSLIASPDDVNDLSLTSLLSTSTTATESNSSSSDNFSENLLYQISIADKKPNTAQKIGRAFTWVAMIPQGEFAGLLMVVFARKLKKYSVYLYIATAVGTGIPVAICATWGKFEIVWDFGERHWRKLGDKTWRQFFADMSPHTWTWNKHQDSGLHPFPNSLFGITEKLLTFNTALSFGMLARVANDPTIGAGYLAKEIGIQPFTAMGKHLFPSPIWQVIFGIPSFASNLMSFGDVHRHGAHYIYQSLRDFIDIFNSDDTDNNINDTKKFTAMFAYFADAINCGKISDAQALLKSITTQESGEFTTLFNSVVNCYQKAPENYQTYLPKQESQCEKSITWFSGTCVAILTSLGLLNFSKMPKLIFSTLPEWFQPPEFVSDTMGWIFFISMGLMAATVYPQVKSYAERAFGRKKPSIRFCSSRQDWCNFIKAQLICIVGSTPNIFQAILANLGLPATIAACFASWCLEIRAVRNRYEKLERIKAMKTNQNRWLVGSVGSMLFEAIEQGDTTEANRIAEKLQTAFNPS